MQLLPVATCEDLCASFSVAQLLLCLQLGLWHRLCGLSRMKAGVHENQPNVASHSHSTLSPRSRNHSQSEPVSQSHSQTHATAPTAATTTDAVWADHFEAQCNNANIHTGIIQLHFVRCAQSNSFSPSMNSFRVNGVLIISQSWRLLIYY